MSNETQGNRRITDAEMNQRVREFLENQAKRHSVNGIKAFIALARLDGTVLPPGVTEVICSMQHR